MRVRLLQLWKAISVDMLLTLLALAMSTLSLAWQIIDATVKRSEALFLATAPAIQGPASGWTAAKDGRLVFVFDLVNVGESPVAVLAIEPVDLLKPDGNLPKRLEPGEVLRIRTIEFEVSRSGVQAFGKDPIFGVANIFPTSGEAITVKTARGTREFPTRMGEKLSEALAFEESVAKSSAALRNAP